MADCKSGCLKCNDDPVHAWDEAVAFYSGSLEGADGSGSGKLLYALADKRCANFATCASGAAGQSKVNIAIMRQFSLGKLMLNEGKCNQVTPIKNRIVELMSIPLVQGSLRYAYKVGTLGEGDKARAEGAAFSAAILPRVAACNADAAKLISDNMAIDTITSMKSGFAAVKKAFESTYACMGMTCEDVGGLTSGSGSADDSRRRRGSSSSSSSSSYADGAAPCARTPEPTGAAHCSAGAISLITGYHTQTDVTQHSLIDLDQKEMEAHLGATPVAFDKAKQIYASGGNSGGTAVLLISALQAPVTKGTYVSQGSPPTAAGRVKSPAKAGDTSLTVSYTSMCKKGGSSSPVETGCFTVSIVLSVGDVSIGQPSAVTNKYRTLGGFSTAALKKMKGQVFFDVYHCYYMHGDYADKYVMAALDGTGAFKGQPEAARIQGAKKGSAYMNVWMYVIREMEDAMQDCKSGCLKCNDDPVHTWDEAVAFYSGSLEGHDGSGSGKLLHALADKRCANFGTCKAGTKNSKVNSSIIEQFKLGKTKLDEGKCADLRPITNRIVELMSIPMVQGSLRYAYKVGKLGEGDKARAEGAAFSAAILPRVAACDAGAVKIISDDMNIDTTTSMKSGFVAVKKAFESTYKCMGFKCEDVGGLLEGTKYFKDADPCTVTPDHDHD